MKAQQKEGVNRVMYGRLSALMTFPSAYKDLMEDALSHTRWRERGRERPSNVARWRLNNRKKEGEERKRSRYCHL